MTATSQTGASYTFPLFDLFAYAGGPVGEEIDQFPFYVNSPALVSYDCAKKKSARRSGPILKFS